MKILLATFWLVPHVGGVWNFMQQIKRRLEAIGHEVDLMGNSPDYAKFHIVNRGLELSKETIRPLLLSKLNAANAPLLHMDPIVQQYEFDRYSMELSAAFFGLDRYDIIHTQDIFSTRALSRAKPRKTPLIAHIHGSVADEMMTHFRRNPGLGIHEGSPAWKYFRSIEHYGASSTTLTITANKWQKQKLVNEFGVPEHLVTSFPYGLDTEAFWQKVRSGTDFARPPGKKVIICPARLVFVKGIDVLISALAILKHSRQDWVCWIVGDGDDRAQLESQAASLGLYHDVWFLGQRHDVAALLAQSDIFVHSCIHDNQPFSVMEAQIAGVPPLVSNAGGLPEMVEHGATGLISPVRDATTLSEQLKLLLEHEDYRLQLGRNAQAWGTEHWSLDRMIERLLAIYCAALAQSA